MATDPGDQSLNLRIRWSPPTRGLAEEYQPRSDTTVGFLSSILKVKESVLAKYPSAHFGSWSYPQWGGVIARMLVWENNEAHRRGDREIGWIEHTQ
jgi:hypothetical protein